MKVSTRSDQVQNVQNCCYNAIIILRVFLRNFYLRSHYSWTQRHADTLRQWRNEMLTPTKRSQPDMPTFSHVDMRQVVMLACWYAETDLLKRLLPDALRRWHGDMQTWRHSDACWHVDILIQTCWCWHSDMLTCRGPEDTLILTFWHADMQTCRHADVYTLTVWQADVLTCKRTDTLMLSFWPADLKRRWHVDILSQ